MDNVCTMCGQPFAAAGRFCGGCGAARGGAQAAVPASAGALVHAAPVALASAPPVERALSNGTGPAVGWSVPHETTVPQPRSAAQQDSTGGFDTPPATPADSTASNGQVRHLDRAAVASSMVELPHVLLSAALVGVFTWLLASQSVAFAVIVGVCWLASGALLFYKPAEAAIARLFFKVRHATSREGAVLTPAWENVCRQAQIDPASYLLWVEDSDEINAFASAGHIVAITRFAATLPPRQLEGVLAHELGHHLGGHAEVGLLTWWYSLPARLMYGLLARVPLLYFAAGVALIVVSFMYFPPLIVVVIGGPLSAWASRRAEFAADRTAVELSYGQDMVDLFERWQFEGHDDDWAKASWRVRLTSSHPSCAQRILAIEQATPQPAAF